VGDAGDAPMTLAISEVPPRPSRFSNVTTTGVIMITVWAVIIAVILYALFDSINSERLATYGGRVLMGFGVTLKLVVISLLVGAILSLPVAAGRLSHNRFIAALSFGYTYFFRGTPLIAQIFLIYYGAGQFAPQLKAIGLWWFFRDSFNCAILSFAINTAAYQAEILSGAIRNVPMGQREAARALGFHKLAELRKVVLPQAFISALRPYGNEVILMTKASSIASIITVLDLMGQTRFVFSKTYDLSFYFWAAAFYLVSVEVFSRVVNAVERRITRHLHLRQAPR
jgi:polar amino acid transport system permease protein